MNRLLIGISYALMLSVGSIAFAESVVNNDNAVINEGAANNENTINNSEEVASKGVVKFLPKNSRLSFKLNLLNQHVYNEKNEKIGDIRDVLFDSSGNITHYVVGAGGFMGVAEHDVAISLSEFEHENNHFILRNYTKEKLKSLTEVEPLMKD